MTLAIRPIGSGTVWNHGGPVRASDQPLMVDIIAYSVFELASAFAPSLKVFLDLAGVLWNRDGRGMGCGRGVGV